MRENTRQTHKATGSSNLALFLILFIMGCVVGLFLIVVKITRFSEASNSPKDAQVTTSTSASRSGKKPRPQAANSKKKAGATDAHSLSVGIRTAVPSSEPEQNASTMNVKSDSTPVFQSNSTDSALVKSLNKGDEVRVELEIINSQGAWSLIRDAGRSGFVPSEMLERKTPTEQAQQ